MPDRLEYLATLEAEARRRLDAETARALTQEVSGHLGESIQARLELGMVQDRAEAEAVAAFGPASRVVRREVAVRQGRWHTPVLTALTVLGATWLPLILSGTKFGAAAFSFASLAFVALVVPFMMSCATRRPGRSLLASIAAFWLLTTALLVTTCGPFYGGPMGRSSLAGIADLYAGRRGARPARGQVRPSRLALTRTANPNPAGSGLLHHHERGGSTRLSIRRSRRLGPRGRRGRRSVRPLSRAAVRRRHLVRADDGARVSLDPLGLLEARVSRERFLAELADEAGKSLPPAEAEALVAEVRDHLEESIQARLELGTAREEAERDAIAAFGSTSRIGREIASRGSIPVL